MVKRSFLFNELKLLKIGLVNSRNYEGDRRYYYLYSVVESHINALLANDKLSARKLKK